MLSTEYQALVNEKLFSKWRVERGHLQKQQQHGLTLEKSQYNGDLVISGPICARERTEENTKPGKELEDSAKQFWGTHSMISKSLFLNVPSTYLGTQKTCVIPNK